MKLGDFFSSATHAKPVNPRPFKFTAICDEATLPGGETNRSGGQVKATVEACFIFVNGEASGVARDDAMNALRSVDPKTKLPKPVDDGDFVIEVKYQILTRAIRESTKRGARIQAGGPMFEAGASQMRKLVMFTEMERLWELYQDYVKAEHPRDLDDPTFRDAEGGDPRPLPPPSDGLLEDQGVHAEP